MEKSSKRGKIPQSDWPLIMARYEAGETLSSIARTYDCSPPAISYVVSRSRSRQPAATAPAAGATEPQLVKSAVTEASQDALKVDASRTDTPAAGPVPLAERAVRPESLFPVVAEHRVDDRQRGPDGMAGNGTGARAPAPPHNADPAPRQAEMSPAASPANHNGDARRTLHLSLGGNPHGNGAHDGGTGSPAETPAAPRRDFSPHQQPFQPPTPPRPAFDSPPSERRPSNEGTPPGNGSHNGAHHKEHSFIDQELRTRVNDDITLFLAAFDAALVQDSQESRTQLREATDRLLRAGARTRIELERLEARVPLPPRDHGRGEPSWRR